MPSFASQAASIIHHQTRGDRLLTSVSTAGSLATFSVYSLRSTPKRNSLLRFSSAMPLISPSFTCLSGMGGGRYALSFRPVVKTRWCESNHWQHDPGSGLSLVVSIRGEHLVGSSRGHTLGSEQNPDEAAAMRINRRRR